MKAHTKPAKLPYGLSAALLVKLGDEKKPLSNVRQTARRVTHRVIQQKFLKYSKIPVLKKQKENRPFIE